MVSEMAARSEFVELPNIQDHWKDLKLGIENLAEKKVKGLEAFEKILSENDHWESISTPFSLLRQVLSSDAHFTEEYFCETLLPWIAGKALQVEELFKGSGHKLPNLYKGRIEEVILTRQQVCCILALCFLNSFPIPKTSTYQHFTLALFLSFALYASQRGKLLCILHYFDRIYQADIAGNNDFLSMCISVSRHHMKEEDASGLSWGKCESPLSPFESPTDGGLIEGAHGCLQVDFANAYIGGGVLNMGNVQEEIRFCISPECLVSLLLCEEMTDLESILITGAEQFTTYTGYGGRFKCTGPYEDTNPVDFHNRRKVYIIAIDATPFDSATSQYTKQSILRELNKAYSGFSHQVADDKCSENSMTEVATGNWGCGMFGGNKQLKTLIQWMAASRAGRPLRYYTFREPQLIEEQMKVTKVLLERKVTVSQLYEILISGREALENNVFKFVLDSLSKLEAA